MDAIVRGESRQDGRTQGQRATLVARYRRACVKHFIIRFLLILYSLQLADDPTDDTYPHVYEQSLDCSRAQ